MLHALLSFVTPCLIACLSDGTPRTGYNWGKPIALENKDNILTVPVSHLEVRKYFHLLGEVEEVQIARN